MSYEETISDVVKVVEAVGAAIMVFGGLGAFVVFLLRVRRAETEVEIDGVWPWNRRQYGSRRPGQESEGS
jgi:hypothetical protein